MSTHAPSLSSEARPVPITDPRASQRVPYTAIQAVAPVRHGSPVDEASFADVACHDISIGGLSFWSNAPPETTHLVVRLNSAGSVTYMLMHVRHATERRHGDRMQYLVGCEFVRRIQPHSVVS